MFVFVMLYYTTRLKWELRLHEKLTFQSTSTIFFATESGKLNFRVRKIVFCAECTKSYFASSAQNRILRTECTKPYFICLSFKSSYFTNLRMFSCACSILHVGGGFRYWRVIFFAVGHQMVSFGRF